MVITGRSICRQADLPFRYSAFILYIHGSRQSRLVCCCLSLGTGYKGTAQNGGQEQACCSKRNKAYPGSTAGSLIAITSLYCIRMAVQGCRENMQRPRASGACYIYTYRLRIFRYGD